MIENKRTVLIAEDEEMLLGTLKEIIEAEGYNVITARDGLEAKEKVLAEKPDLLLLDIQMPKMTGLEALAEIRKDEWGKNIPVIILTNIGDVRNVAGAMDLDAHDYLIKADMSLSDVIKTINDKFEKYVSATK